MTVECHAVQGSIWQTEPVPLPQENLWYLYHVYPEKGFFTRMKALFSKEKRVSDTVRRKLDSRIHICQDVFEPPSTIKLNSDDLCGGLQYHLNWALTSIKEQNSDLSTKLREAEHFCKFNDEILTKDNISTLGECIIKNLKSATTSSSKEYKKIVVLAALSSRFTSNQFLFDLQPFRIKTILDTISDTNVHDLTDWSILQLRKTVMTLLKAKQKRHWLHIIGYFSNIFDINEVVAMNVEEEDIISFTEIEKEVIPRIRRVFKTNPTDLRKVLLKIPEITSLEIDERKSLLSVVEKELHHEISGSGMFQKYEPVPEGYENSSPANTSTKSIESDVSRYQVRVDDIRQSNECRRVVKNVVKTRYLNWRPSCHLQVITKWLVLQFVKVKEFFFKVSCFDLY